MVVDRDAEIGLVVEDSVDELMSAFRAPAPGGNAMSTRVDVTLLPTLQSYGAFDINACSDSRICTAICPLSTEGSTFPRRLIGYAHRRSAMSCLPARRSGPATHAVSAP